jgi:hypothetical protein
MVMVMMMMMIIIIIIIMNRLEICGGLLTWPNLKSFSRVSWKY